MQFNIFFQYPNIKYVYRNINLYIRILLKRSCYKQDKRRWNGWLARCIINDNTYQISHIRLYNICLHAFSSVICNIIRVISVSSRRCVVNFCISCVTSSSIWFAGFLFDILFITFEHRNTRDVLRMVLPLYKGRNIQYVFPFDMYIHTYIRFWACYTGHTDFDKHTYTDHHAKRSLPNATVSGSDGCILFQGYTRNTINSPSGCVDFEYQRNTRFPGFTTSPRFPSAATSLIYLSFAIYIQNSKDTVYTQYHCFKWIIQLNNTSCSRCDIPSGQLQYSSDVLKRAFSVDGLYHRRIKILLRLYRLIVMNVWLK